MRNGHGIGALASPHKKKKQNELFMSPNVLILFSEIGEKPKQKTRRDGLNLR